MPNSSTLPGALGPPTLELVSHPPARPYLPWLQSVVQPQAPDVGVSACGGRSRRHDAGPARGRVRPATGLGPAPCSLTDTLDPRHITDLWDLGCGRLWVEEDASGENL